MKNKIRFLFPLIILAFLFIPKAFAGSYDCPYNLADPSTCCLDGEDGYQGVYCNPGEYIQKVGSNSPSCKISAEIMSLAAIASTKHRVGFNCFTGAISGMCQANWCKPSGSNVCELLTGNACPSELNRQLVCPGGCGGCSEGYVYCVDDQPAGLLDEPDPDGDTLACVEEKDGSALPINGGLTCAEMGREVGNPCTGECTDCPAGKTASGRTPNLCINFAQRFIEIFYDGLTSLGGNAINVGGVDLAHVYSYGSINDPVDWSDTSAPAFYGTLFAEVDQADHLNWSSPSVPDVIQNMLVTNNYLFCDENYDCPGSLICTAGICNNPDAGGGEGGVCDTSSDCNLGLVCDMEIGECVDAGDPNNTLTECTENADCADINPAYTCVNGYCHDQTNSAGDACAADVNCAAGLMCVGDICVYNSSLIPTPYFVDVTDSSYAGDLAGGQGYLSADALCNDEVEGSHVCSSIEIISSYLADAPGLANVTNEIAYVNSGVPGNVVPAVSDCGGWNKGISGDPTTDAAYYATVWNFSLKAPGIQPCFGTKQFACCL